MADPDLPGDREKTHPPAPIVPSALSTLGILGRGRRAAVRRASDNEVTGAAVPRDRPVELIAALAVSML